MSRKTCLLIAALCLLLAVACAHRIWANVGWQPTCVPLSIMNAWTAGQNGQQVRIAVTKTDATTDHSQAQAMIGGVWTPLTEQWTGRHLEIRPWAPHFPTEPYRYLTLREWIDEQLPYTNQGG